MPAYAVQLTPAEIDVTIKALAAVRLYSEVEAAQSAKNKLLDVQALWSGSAAGR